MGHLKEDVVKLARYNVILSVDSYALSYKCWKVGYKCHLTGYEMSQVWNRIVGGLLHTHFWPSSFTHSSYIYNYLFTVIYLQSANIVTLWCHQALISSNNLRNNLLIAFLLSTNTIHIKKRTGLGRILKPWPQPQILYLHVSIIKQMIKIN